jgi:uncharacterized protein YbjQ (UPF0145 family)
MYSSAATCAFVPASVIPLAYVPDHLDLTPEADPMIVSTMNDLPGHEVSEVIADVFGLTVFVRGAGSNIEAGLRTFFGGEARGLVAQLTDGRLAARRKLIETAEARGADAVLAMCSRPTRCATSGRRSVPTGPPYGFANATDWTKDREIVTTRMMLWSDSRVSTLSSSRSLYRYGLLSFVGTPGP